MLASDKFEVVSWESMIAGTHTAISIWDTVGGLVSPCTVDGVR